MSNFEEHLQRSLRGGATASVTTTLAIAACGVLENDNAVAPVNAISHITWGDEAAAHEEPSWKYTATGLALNTAAVTGWAAVHELLFGKVAKKSLATAVACGVATSALAYVTDYVLVPERFTPGFEKRLSNTSLLAIYGVLALSLALGSQGELRLRANRPA